MKVPVSPLRFLSLAPSRGPAHRDALAVKHVWDRAVGRIRCRGVVRGAREGQEQEGGDEDPHRVWPENCSEEEARSWLFS